MARTARAEAAIAAKRAERAAMFPHTERVEELLRDGKRGEARAEYLARVDSELERARAGETICLSDLIAGGEAFVIDKIERGEG